MNWSKGKFALALCGLAVALAAPASAQMAPANGGPQSETGIHVGGFMFYPTLDIGGIYTDNVFAAQSAAKSDFVWEVRPALTLQNTASRYMVALTAQYDHRGHAKYNSEDSDDYLIGGKAAANLGSSSMFDISSEYARLTEARGDTNSSINAAKPTNYTRWSNAADFKHLFVRLQADIGATFTRMRFENTPAVGGGTLLEVRRDRDVTGEYVDLGYQFSPGYQVFARGSLNQRQYRLSYSNYRNSSGYEAVAGLRAKVSRLIDAQVYVGYLSQDYGGFAENIGGFDYGLQLDWDLTPLTKLKADVSRSIEETDQLGSPSYFVTAAAFGIEHALTRSWTLKAGVSYANNKYHNIIRDENVYSASGGVDYAFTPRFHFAADYRYTTRNTNVAGAGYEQNLFQLQLKFAV